MIGRAGIRVSPSLLSARGRRTRGLEGYIGPGYSGVHGALSLEDGGRVACVRTGPVFVRGSRLCRRAVRQGGDGMLPQRCPPLQHAGQDRRLLQAGPIFEKPGIGRIILPVVCRRQRRPRGGRPHGRRHPAPRPLSSPSVLLFPRVAPPTGEPTPRRSTPQLMP